MQRVTDPSVSTALPAASSTGSPGYFTSGNAAAGVAATIVTEDFLNGVQEELIGVIEDAGETPNISDNTQLLTALKKLFAGLNGNNSEGFSAAGFVVVSEDGKNSAFLLSPNSTGAGAEPNALSIRTGASGAYVYNVFHEDGRLSLGAAATGNGDALPLGQANSTFAAINGSSAQPFDVEEPAANDKSNQAPSTSWLWGNIQALVASCIGAVATAAGFSYSFAGNGYLKLPSWLGGLLFEWGTTATSAGAATTVTFPLAFPVGTFSIMAVNILGGGAPFCWPGIGSSTPNNFEIWQSSASNTGASGNASWFAIGR